MHLKLLKLCAVEGNDVGVGDFEGWWVSRVMMLELIMLRIGAVEVEGDEALGHVCGCQG